MHKENPQAQHTADNGNAPLGVVSHRAINARFSSPESILVPENWKDAKGIEASHRETNSSLAKRNYDCRCDFGTSPLVVVEGYHIWWCKSHHQPFYKCEAERYSHGG